MIAFFILSACIFIAGAVTGALFVWPRRRPHTPRIFTLPTNTVVRLNPWRHLDVPTVRRRVMIPVVRE